MYYIILYHIILTVNYIRTVPWPKLNCDIITVTSHTTNQSVLLLSKSFKRKREILSYCVNCFIMDIETSKAIQ